MFRVIVLAAIFFCNILVHGSENEFQVYCKKLIPLSSACCTMEIVQKTFKEKAPILLECSKLPPPPACDQAICLGVKSGYATADGTLDKAKVIKMIDDDFGEVPDIVAAIKEKCINGDVSKYGPPEFCDLLKIETCVRIQALGLCKSWTDAGLCNGTSEAARHCYKLFQ